MANCLIVGCGAIGSQLAQTLVLKGHTVTGLKRRPPVNAGSGIHYFAADITLPDTLKQLPTDFDQVFFILAPDGRDANSYNAVYRDGLQHLLAHFANAHQQPPFFMVSSTSVYAQNQGEWVDEDSVAKPTTATSLAIRTAEQQLQNLSAQHCIVRFSGIYGPGRESLIRQARQAPVIQQSPPYFTNRIHAQDCINVLVFLFEQRLAGKPLASCYLASDNEPAPLWEVMNWLTMRLQLPPPILKPITGILDQNKRCSNQRLKALGFCFQYPNFRSGYGELIDNARI